MKPKHENLGCLEMWNSCVYNSAFSILVLLSNNSCEILSSHFLQQLIDPPPPQRFPKVNSIHVYICPIAATNVHWILTEGRYRLTKEIIYLDW